MMRVLHSLCGNCFTRFLFRHIIGYFDRVLFTFSACVCCVSRLHVYTVIDNVVVVGSRRRFIILFYYHSLNSFVYLFSVENRNCFFRLRTAHTHRPNTVQNVEYMFRITIRTEREDGECECRRRRCVMRLDLFIIIIGDNTEQWNMMWYWIIM